MSNAWTMLTAGALQLYDGSKLLSAAAVRERAARQVRHKGEQFPGLVPSKPRDDAHGMPALTQADVKAALGGLRDRPFLFGMAAFLGDAGALRQLEAYLHSDMQQHAIAGEWIEDEKDLHTLSLMSELTLFEVITARSRNEDLPGGEKLPKGSAKIRCPACNGRGTSTRSARSLCEECGGDGTFLLTELRRAQLVRVTERTWHRRWKGRYNEFLTVPLEWERRAISHVRWKLTGIRNRS